MVYDFLLFLYLVILLPKYIFDLVFLKKRKLDLLKRIGLKKYSFKIAKKASVFWIHAVSLGEVKSASILIEKLKKEYPNSFLILSTVTQTGFDEAKKNKLVDQLEFFPFDFSKTVKNIFSQIKPKYVIFIESDLWPNFIKQAKKNNAKVLVVSAKISEKSSIRYSKFNFLLKGYFSSIDLVLCQNKIYYERFSKFIDKNKLHITGNLKFLLKSKILSKTALINLKNYCKIKDEFVIIVASSHEPEEISIIKALKKIPNIKILLVPRHPERFKSVYLKINKIISCSLYSNIKNCKVILVDKMGILNDLYQISNLAIVAGSFVEKVGGHNILEPILLKTPTFFGPYMHTQLQMKKLAIQFNCAKQIEINDLEKTISNYIKSPDLLNEMQKNTNHFTFFQQSILEDTFYKIITLE